MRPSRDDHGTLTLEGISVFEIGSGTYRLVETEAPSGFDLKAEPVTVIVSDSDRAVDADNKETYEVGYNEGTAISADKTGITYVPETGTYIMLITNKSGVELPSAGGCGTHAIYAAGLLLLIVCGIALAAQKRLQYHDWE